MLINVAKYYKKIHHAISIFFYKCHYAIISLKKSMI
jgi:hypothetical protein